MPDTLAGIAASSRPLRYAEELGDRPSAYDGLPFDPPWPSQARVRYVVKADIASFYDYVDHDILGRELLVRPADHAAVECLLDLLGEVQGRRYGLPQLLEPSDRLSDLYAGRVLRALRRRPWAAWRFNDDFRIAVESFEDAKRALDDLSAAARDNGLVLNESKTRTPSMMNYWLEGTLSQVDVNLSRAGARHDPADLVADYTEGARDVDPEWAPTFLESIVTPRDLVAGADREGTTDLREVDRRETLRYVRRALIRLADPAEPRALSVLAKMESIVGFAASATPYVLRYLTAMAELDRPAVVRVVEAITADNSLSDWQRLCLIRSVGELGLLDAEPLLAWTASHRDHRFGPAVRAEAVLALAAADGVGPGEIVRAGAR